MRCCYQRLTHEEREEISKQLAIGQSIREIAKNLGRAPSTISRETSKGSANKYIYRALRSQNRASRNSKKRRDVNKNCQ